MDRRSMVLLLLDLLRARDEVVSRVAEEALKRTALRLLFAFPRARQALEPELERLGEGGSKWEGLEDLERLLRRMARES